MTEQVLRRTKATSGPAGQHAAADDLDPGPRGRRDGRRPGQHAGRLGGHLALSVGFGASFAAVTAARRDPAILVVGGLVWGALLYLLNFHVLAPLAFTTMKAANKPFELTVHLVFGALLAAALLPRAGHQPAMARR